MSGCAGHRISSPFTFISYLSIGVQQSGSIIEEGDLHLRRHGRAREPAVALAQLMREKDPETEFLFVGAERGLEKDLIPKAGYDFRTVHISSFHRSFKPREIRHNLVSVGNLLRAPGEARAILRQFRPDVVIGTGGYASFPMVKAAAKAGIPTAVHESNMVPGLTTEMLEPFADRIMVGFEACREHYRHPEKVIVTGTPVRRDFFHLTKAEAKRRLGVEDGRPLLVSFWGSLGASGMNRQMADFLALEAAKEPFHHIHGAGKDGYPVLLKLLQEKGVDLADHPALQVRSTSMIWPPSCGRRIWCSAGRGPPPSAS